MIAVEIHGRSAQSDGDIGKRKLQSKVDFAARRGGRTEAIRRIVGSVVDVAARLLVADTIGLRGGLELHQPQGCHGWRHRLVGSEFLQLQGAAVIDEERGAQTKVIVAATDEERLSILCVQGVGQALQVAANGCKTILNDGLHQQGIAVIGGVAVSIFLSTVDGIAQRRLDIGGPKVCFVAGKSHIFAVVPELQEARCTFSTPLTRCVVGTNVARIGAVSAHSDAVSHLVHQRTCGLIVLF